LLAVWIALTVAATVIFGADPGLWAELHASVAVWLLWLALAGTINGIVADAGFAELISTVVLSV
jgi:hypothetical protein